MKDLKSVLDALLSKKVPGYTEKAKELEIFQCWEKAAGERIAKNCWPVRMLDKETLLIASDSSVWLHQLKYLEKILLENIEKELKDNRVKKLRFKMETRS